MATNHRRLQRDFAVPLAQPPGRPTRIDDPELVLEAAACRERNNQIAVRLGLPVVGSRLVNRYGLEFVVESHVHVPTANSVQRWRDGSPSDADLFPSIIPQNLSDQLTSFVASVDRCTTKTLLVLDTMPHARRDAGVPSGHWVDSVGNAGANLLFIDAAQIHETHFAHEVGHLWVQYVDQAEDMRVMQDVSDPGRLHQLSFVQSFVTDLRVNQVIAERGFDVSLIQEDQAASIASLGRAIGAGYRPESLREGVFMALALAAQILEERGTGTNELATLDDTLTRVSRLDPRLARLANGFAEAAIRYGFQGKEQIRAAIDECLILAFDFTGDGIDLERDLVVPATPEPDLDKYPQWIEGESPHLKCEVGRIMAREDIPDGSRWSISQADVNARLLTFELPDGTTKGPWTLESSHGATTRFEAIQRIDEINRQNRERQMQPPPRTGPPSFPGQPRRFYMAGTARFLTSVREAEWLGGEHPYAYALNNPVTYADPSGNVPQKDFAGRPTLPPGQSYVANCCEARRHPWPQDPTWFYNQVRLNGPWDFKQDKRSDYQDAGNYHYGFVAACAGISLEVALRAAGFAHMMGGNYRSSFGRPWGRPPYGDDPADQRQIMSGYRNAQRWMGEIDRKCSLNTMKGCYQHFSDWRDREIERGLREGGGLPVHQRWWDY